MKKLLTPLILLNSSCIAYTSYGKGLDKLQAETSSEEPATKNEPAQENVKAVTEPTEVKPPPPVENPPPQKIDGATKAPESTPIVVKEPTTPIEPGLQKYYLGSGVGIFNISAKSAGWHSAVAADLELGIKTLQLANNINVFATYRYLASDITANADQRSYRGIVEIHHFGSKAHMLLKEKLLAFASGELGLVQTHLTPSDGRIGTDKDLQKPGVELTLGGGVSYTVLDKLGVGARVAFGSGTYNSVQLGLDLRFLF